MMPIPEILPLSAMAIRRTTIYPAVTEPLVNPLVYSNAHLAGQEWFTRLRLQASLARDVQMGEVFLGTYPPGAVLTGQHTHWVLADGALNSEQIYPDYTNIAGTLADLEARVSETLTIDDPCVLLARYGSFTWAHWLGDLLPKAIAAEDAFPRQFRYAVPAEIIDPGPQYPFNVQQSYADAVLGSLAAYGIGRDRLLKIEPRYNYRFAELMDVQSVWLYNVMHPGILRAMRENIARPGQRPAASGGRLAILRRDTVTRPIHNNAEVEAYLAREGFEIATMTDLPFIERAALVRDHGTVFGIWGSGLMYLMYAMPGTKVLSVAPTDWVDNFITGIIQQCDCRFADIRGPSLWSGKGLVRDAPFIVDLQQLAIGLDRLDQPPGALHEDDMIEVMGTTTPVRVGPAEFTLDFTAGGNAWTTLETGWSVQEPYHIWALGALSTLSLPAEPFTGDYIIEMDCSIMMSPPHFVSKSVAVQVNDVNLASFTASGRGLFTFKLPHQVYAGHNRLRFTFDHPICPSPRALGISMDERPLGLALTTLRFRRLLPGVAAGAAAPMPG